VQAQLQGSLAAAGNPTVSAAVTAFPGAPADAPADAAAREANAGMIRHLHKLGTVGAVEVLQSPWELFALARTHSAGAMNNNVFKVHTSFCALLLFVRQAVCARAHAQRGPADPVRHCSSLVCLCTARCFVSASPILHHRSLQVGEFEISVKAGKIGSHDTGPTFRPYTGSLTAPDPEGFLNKDTALFLKAGDKVAEAVEARCACLPGHVLHIAARLAVGVQQLRVLLPAIERLATVGNTAK
jgi:hypothetical protein